MRIALALLSLLAALSVGHVLYALHVVRQAIQAGHGIDVEAIALAISATVFATFSAWAIISY